MESERTSITGRNLNKLRTEIWTTEDILEFLNNGAVYRSFKDVLSKVCHEDHQIGQTNLEQKLTENMCQLTGKSKALMSKNVKNWLYHDMIPQRKQLFQICFALELDEKEANTLISSASETGIHYRDPEEIIYAYGLRKGKGWKETEELINKLLPLCRQEMQDIEKDRDAFSRAYKISTNVIRDKFFSSVDSDQELESFLADFMPVLGQLHLAAYRDFISMLEILRLPEQKAQKYSVEKIVDEYLKMGVPDHTTKGNKTDYSPLQKVIKKNWPSDDLIMKMINRHIDVSRKVMLLLFLVTEEFEAGGNLHLHRKSADNLKEKFLEDMIADFENFEAEEVLEMRIDQMNLFLDSYGINRLDPCNAFDCIVLYAFKASLDSQMTEHMDSRMRTILKEIF